MSLQVGNYILDRQIGRGATARVWIGRHRHLAGRQYAIKATQSITDVDTQLLHREALTMSRLSHPAIPHIYDYGIMPRFHYIVMDYAPGVSLRHLLKVHRTLSVTQTLDIATAVADVLDYIHAQGVIHRDINPNNILVDNAANTTRISLIDFGIARDTTQTTMHLPVSELGTKAYSAPEQRADGDDVMHVSDIYSFGVMLFEMLAGNVPWDDVPTHTVPTLAQRGASGIPSEIDDVMAKLLAYTALERYHCANDAVADMRRIIAKHTAETSIVVDDTPVVIAQAAHPVEVVLAVELKRDIINESLAFAQQTGTPEVIRELMNTWGEQHFYRRKLLGRIANITSIHNRTIFHYTLSCISETRQMPQIVTTTSALADEAVGDEVRAVDRWLLSIPAVTPTTSEGSGTLVIPGSQTAIACPHCENGKRICPSCHNHPIVRDDGTPVAACATCSGSGYVACYDCMGTGQRYQHHVMQWRRTSLIRATHDDTAHVPQAWLQQHCTPRVVYHHIENNGIRPEWKRIPNVAQLSDEISTALTPDSRIVRCELTITVVPMSEFFFDIGNEWPWQLSQLSQQYRWVVYGFERILAPHHKLLDWRLLLLIVLSVLCFILTVVIGVVVT